VDEIHKKMQAAKISQKIIERTYLEQRTIKSDTGKGLVFFIRSDYTSEKGFAVAVMIERGRIEYDIFPKPPTPERPKPSLKYIKNGETFYRK
jgi:hypothetical protein